MVDQRTQDFRKKLKQLQLKHLEKDIESLEQDLLWLKNEKKDNIK